MLKTSKNIKKNFVCKTCNITSRHNGGKDEHNQKKRFNTADK